MRNNKHASSSFELLKDEPEGSGDVAAHATDTTSVHGIADTSLLETAAGAQAKVDAHSSDTTDVHGIADTAVVNASVTELTNTRTFGKTDQTPASLSARLAWLDNAYNVVAYGAVGDGTTDDTAAIQEAIDQAKTANNLTVGPSSVRWGTPVVLFPPGRYKTTSTLTVDGDVVMRGAGGHSCATIEYTGSGTAIVVNSTNLTGLTPVNTRVFSFENIALIAESASRGFIVGTATNRHVSFKRGQVMGVLGRGIELGDAVYFCGLDNFEVRDCDEGVFVSTNCDLFTVQNRCMFWRNRGADIIIESQVFRIENSDFESNDGTGGNANIIIRASGSISETRAGMIFDNRFGSERQGTTIAEYDIQLEAAVGASSDVLDGIRIWGNKHHAPNSGDTKVAPINIIAPPKNLDIRGNYRAGGFTSEYYVVTDNLTDARASGLQAPLNYIDQILQVEPQLRGIFGRSDEHFYIPAVTAAAVSAEHVMYTLSYYDTIAFAGPKVLALAASSSSTNYSKYIGVSTYAESTSSKPLWIARPGAVIESTLDCSSSTYWDPVYVQNDGSLGLTIPATKDGLVVARVLQTIPDAKLMVVKE